MAAFAVAPERFDGEFRLIRGDGNDFGVCQTQKAIKPGTSELPPTPLDDARGLHLGNGGYEPDVVVFYETVETAPLSLIAQDRDNRRGIDHHMPFSS